MASKEFLNSDRINFLIWRYLLEGNYRETAAKFQKEWHVAEPHRQFEFAPYVKTRALVSVVNGGLQFYALQREHSRSLPQPCPPETGLFGPLGVQYRGPDWSHHHQYADDDDEREQARKRSLDPVLSPRLTNGAASKRPRLTNGYTNGSVAVASNPMDFEPSAERHPHYHQRAPGSMTPRASQHDIQHHLHPNISYPSPMERDLVATPIIHTDGPEQATQVDKVEELTAETIYLPLGVNEAIYGHAESENHPVLLHCQWSPQDPFSLAVAGTDGFARLFNVPTQPEIVRILLPRSDPVASLLNGFPRDATLDVEVVQTGVTQSPVQLQPSSMELDSAVIDHSNDQIIPPLLSPSAPVAPAATDVTNATDTTDGEELIHWPFRSLMEDEASSNATVTALAWNCDGSSIAIATDDGKQASIGIWTPDGSQLHRFDVAEPPIFSLEWNPTGSALLAVAPDGVGTMITVLSLDGLPSIISYFLPPDDDKGRDSEQGLDHDSANWPPPALDATWTSETEFLLCGGSVFLALQFSAAGIEVMRQFSTTTHDNFSHLDFDVRSRLAATANDKGVFNLWDETGQRRSIQAHIGTITALRWQPLLNTGEPEEKRLIASSGDDCAILLWNARQPGSCPRCYLTMDSPVVAIAFTPDGVYIAGATSRNVLIWQVGDHSVPRTSWIRPGWDIPRTPFDKLGLGIGFRDGGGEEDSDDATEEDQHSLSWDAAGRKLAYGVNSQLAVLRFR